MKNLDKKNLDKKNLEKRISRSGYRIETPVRFGFLECLLYAWLFYGSSIQLASQRNEFELQQSFNEQQQCNEYLDWRASRFRHRLISSQLLSRKIIQKQSKQVRPAFFMLSLILFRFHRPFLSFWSSTKTKLLPIINMEGR